MNPTHQTECPVAAQGTALCSISATHPKTLGYSRTHTGVRHKVRKKLDEILQTVTTTEKAWPTRISARSFQAERAMCFIAAITISEKRDGQANSVFRFGV